MTEFFRPEARERLCAIFGAEDGAKRYSLVNAFLNAMPRDRRIIPPPEVDEALHELLAARDGVGTFELVKMEHVIIKPIDPEVRPGFTSVGKTFRQLEGHMAHRSRNVVQRGSLQISPSATYRQPACSVLIAA